MLFSSRSQTLCLFATLLVIGLGASTLGISIVSARQADPKSKPINNDKDLAHLMAEMEAAQARVAQLQKMLEVAKSKANNPALETKTTPQPKIGNTIRSGQNSAVSTELLKRRISAAEAEVVAAQVAAEEAAKQENRALDLSKKGLASEAEVGSARVAAAQAKATLQVKLLAVDELKELLDRMVSKNSVKDLNKNAGASSDSKNTATVPALMVPKNPLGAEATLPPKKTSKDPLETRVEILEKKVEDLLKRLSKQTPPSLGR